MDGQKHSAPWWSDTLEEFVEGRKRTYRKWLETKKPQDREDYQKRRRKTQREITRAKNEYWEKTCEQVDRCMGNTRVNKAWKLIKTMRSNNKDTAGLSLISMNLWFIGLMEKQTSEVHQEEFIQEVPDITPQEIREALKNMKKGKAPGSGNISVKLLKAAPDMLIEILAYILNISFYGEKPPTEWRK